MVTYSLAYSEYYIQLKCSLPLMLRLLGGQTLGVMTSLGMAISLVASRMRQTCCPTRLGCVLLVTSLRRTAACQSATCQEMHPQHTVAVARWFPDPLHDPRTNNLDVEASGSCRNVSAETLEKTDILSKLQRLRLATSLLRGSCASMSTKRASVVWHCFCLCDADLCFDIRCLSSLEGREPTLCLTTCAWLVFQGGHSTVPWCSSQKEYAMQFVAPRQGCVQVSFKMLTDVVHKRDIEVLQAWLLMEVPAYPASICLVFELEPMVYPTVPQSPTVQLT